MTREPTGAPWTVGFAPPVGSTCWDVLAGGDVIARAYFGVTAAPAAEDGLANARLITAAPLLLPVLELAWEARSARRTWLRLRDDQSLIEARRLERQLDERVAPAIAAARGIAGM